MRLDVIQSCSSMKYESNFDEMRKLPLYYDIETIQSINIVPTISNYPAGALYGNNRILYSRNHAYHENLKDPYLKVGSEAWGS